MPWLCSAVAVARRYAAIMKTSGASTPTRRVQQLGQPLWQAIGGCPSHWIATLPSKLSQACCSADSTFFGPFAVSYSVWPNAARRSRKKACGLWSEVVFAAWDSGAIFVFGSVRRDGRRLFGAEAQAVVGTDATSRRLADQQFLAQAQLLVQEALPLHV